MNPEDPLIDEIDRLVDESLARGDQSDSFHGTRYNRTNQCSWCHEGWHYLPITQKMLDMRMGSYGRDEFGQGIVDPDYDYRTDTSEVICPGSEFHGPVPPPRSPNYGGFRQELDRLGRSLERVFDTVVDATSFIYDFLVYPGIDDDWIMEDREYERQQLYSPQRLLSTGVRGSGLRTVTFRCLRPIENPPSNWIDDNQGQILNFGNSRSMSHDMAPIVIPYHRLERFVFWEEDSAFIRIHTYYDLRRHPWFRLFWMPFTLGHRCTENCHFGVYHEPTHDMIRPTTQQSEGNVNVPRYIWRESSPPPQTSRLSTWGPPIFHSGQENSSP